MARQARVQRALGVEKNVRRAWNARVVQIKTDLRGNIAIFNSQHGQEGHSISAGGI